ncbi:MAG: PLDc_N domain-containing protein [Hymenobacter sp.]|nr:MAG: PLDc_N domain-containing protein [Hymenobacter sp.]
MNRLTSYISRLPVLLALLPLILLASSCSAYNDNNQLTIAGVIYVILAIYAVISLLRQDWSLTKKLIWGIVIWFFPIGGSIIYLLFSGRKD